MEKKMTKRMEWFLYKEQLNGIGLTQLEKR